MMVVGNLLLPNSRYMEGCGLITIENTTLDIKCEMDFIKRGYVSDYYTNRVEAKILDSDGNEKYSIDGYYTSELIATNLETDQEEVVFKAPTYPENHDTFYYMNSFALQLN